MLELLAERRGARNRNLQVVELVRDGGVLGQQEVDGRDGEEEGDAVFLVVGEEVRVAEFGHPVGGAAHVERVDEVALHACDVRHGQVGQRAVFVRRLEGAHLVHEAVVSDYGGRDHVSVSEGDAFGEPGGAGGVDERDDGAFELGAVGDAPPFNLPGRELVDAVVYSSQSGCAAGVNL